MKYCCFITGTDTGAGKTLLSGLLLAHLRAKGIRALAMKPFCTGNRRDARFLNALQENELSDNEINPYFFPEAVAPALAAKRHRIRIRIEEVHRAIDCIARRCEYLIIEGAGGLLVPINELHTIEDILVPLKPRVCVAARNRLGVINHVLLTFYRLRQAGIERVKVVLMGTRHQDLASKTNAMLISQYIGRENVVCIKYLGLNASSIRRCKENAIFFKKALDHISELI